MTQTKHKTAAAALQQGFGTAAGFSSFLARCWYWLTVYGPPVRAATADTLYLVNQTLAPAWIGKPRRPTDRLTEGLQSIEQCTTRAAFRRAFADIRHGWQAELKDPKAAAYTDRGAAEVKKGFAALEEISLTLW